MASVFGAAIRLKLTANISRVGARLIAVTIGQKKIRQSDNMNDDELIEIYNMLHPDGVISVEALAFGRFIADTMANRARIKQFEAMSCAVSNLKETVATIDAIIGVDQM